VRHITLEELSVVAKLSRLPKGDRLPVLARKQILKTFETNVPVTLRIFHL